MHGSRKRKLTFSNPSPQSSSAAAEPYPNLHRPTPEECRGVRDDLLALHGFPEEFLKYRRIADVGSDPNLLKSEPLPLPLLGLEDGDDGVCCLEPPSSETHRESVLDGLISILLSQNTTDSNSRKAFSLLKSAFPTWEEVLAAEPKCIEDAIRCGGLASKKTSCITNILRSLLEKRGKICLEYLRTMPVDDVKAELSHFKGIGPKTVLRITKAIGWVPLGADREKAYLHLNKRIPNELKFDLNCLLFTHGKLCQRCGPKGGKRQRKANHVLLCPLMNYIHSTE